MNAKSILIKFQWIIFLLLLAISCSKEPLTGVQPDTMPNALPHL
jgi:hypothetical protein